MTIPAAFASWLLILGGSLIWTLALVLFLKRSAAKSVEAQKEDPYLPPEGVAQPTPTSQKDAP